MSQIKALDTQTNDLASFDFNDPIDFFGIPAKKGETLEAPDEDKKEGIKEVKAVKGEGEEIEEEEIDEEPEFFKEPPKPKSNGKPPKEEAVKKVEKVEKVGKIEEAEEVDEVDEEGEVDTVEGGEDEGHEEDFYTELAKESKQRGIFQNVDIPKDGKIDEDQYFELQDAEVEARVDETFEGFFEEMDDDGKAFLKFKKNGGTTRDFLTQYLQPGLNLEQFDDENAAQVRLINEYYMRNIEGKDEEEIEDGLNWLKDNGKEKVYATKRFEKIKTAEKKRKEEVQEAARLAADKRESDVKQFNQELMNTLAETEKIGDFQISKAEQKELGAYLTKPVIKVGKNKFVPPFQAKIAQIFRAETEKDKQHLILLAKLIKSDFDVSDLVTETQTKVTRKAKSTLSKIKRGLMPKTSGTGGGRQLSDYFEQQ